MEEDDTVDSNAEPGWSLQAYASGGARFDGLIALQRRLDAAPSVKELFARAAEEACRLGGFARALVLSVDEDRLTAGQMDRLPDAASDVLRRRVLADPIPLKAGTPEAELIRHAGGARRARARIPSVLEATLGLRQHVVAPVVPENSVLAILVVDRDDPPATADDRAAVELLAHVLAGAAKVLVLRARMREMQSELRHLTASAQALIREAIEAPLSLPTDFGLGPTFLGAGAGPPAGRLRDVLTPREVEVVAAIAAGRSNREIAAQLNLSPDTVKAYVARICRKLGASNRVEAAVRYMTLSRGGD